MKLSSTVLSAILLLCAGTSVAKRVVDLSFNDEQIHNINLEMEQAEFQLGKREAKNVVNLNLVYDGELDKRDAKNVFGAKLIIDESDFSKRDGKNIFDINLVIDDANLKKRDGKNVFDLHFIIDDNGELENESSTLSKRDAKNVVNFNFIIDEDADLVKRGVENVVDLSIAVPNTEHYYSALQDPLSLGYIIGDSEYTAEKVEKVNENNMNVKLKHNSKGCHQKKKKLNFGHSISKTLATFKEKMLDPVVAAKDKFVVPEKFLGQEVETKPHTDLLEPVKGDIATALVQREDLGVFSKYLRDAPELYRKCETVKTTNTEYSKKQILIFAPTNDAFTQLSKKPWQFPENVNTAKTEQEEDAVIQRNVLNFVETHAAETENFNISGSSNAAEFTTINGKTLVLENLGESFRVRSKDNEEWSNITNIEILENGAILTIDQALIRN